MIRRTFFCLFVLVASHLFSQDPDVLYLTWKNDPSTTMIVMWHTTTGNGPSKVYYKEGEEENWRFAEGNKEQLLRSSINVHQVELMDLKADTDYFFHLEDGLLHRFRTMPQDLKRPLKIAVGGDAYFTKKTFQSMNREVASQSPDFVILAGDIAYAEGLKRALCTPAWKVQRWEEFFQMWTQDMVTQDGRMIPIVPVIGNHDVKERVDNPHKQGVIFYQVFAFPKENIPYRTLCIGDQLCFFLLDTGHSYPIGGAQTEWLDSAFQKHSGVGYKIPVYHVPAYPSETIFKGRTSRDIRKFWVPLFEEHGVKISMEHDNHTFKRTFSLKDGKVNAEGVTYLGDGAWGVPPLRPKRYWYLQKALQSNCYWLLTVTGEKIHCAALDIQGKLLDELEINQ